MNLEKKEKRIKKATKLAERDAKDRQIRYQELNQARKEKFDLTTMEA